MKTKKLYEIRFGQGASHSIRASMKLRSFNRARKLVGRLKDLGHDAFYAPIIIHVGQ